ncbi:MAG: aminodeoxychorismate lyase [Methylotenera sp.]|nr:aminodeoxychorismate lyase [Methylotenera sp.]
MQARPTYIINGDLSQTITPLDRGLVYGDGVFRTMQTRGGMPLNWPLHYQKLVADCAAIGLVCPSAELLMHDFLQLLLEPDLNSNQLAVAKVIITRGEGERGYKTPAVTCPNRILIVSSMPFYAEVNYATGVDLHLCELRLSVQEKLAGIKHLNRLENVMARMEWRDDGVFDGLLLDQQDNVIECTMANVFARFGNQLLTPDLSRCGVSGITRERIVSLAAVLNLSVQVCQLPLKRFMQADEIILCNSLFGAFQVRTIKSSRWSQQALAKNFRDLLAHD